MDNPPDEMRPGLSCTAKITTATRQSALTVPIQALTVRQKGDLEPQPPAGQPVVVKKYTPAKKSVRKKRFRASLLSRMSKAMFHKVETGITGATDIEVLSGLKEGDQIVTGSFR